MYYVSYIEEYPIYEPAEGGYYYAGEQVLYCHEYSTWRKARQAYNKIRREFEEEYEWYKERVHRYEPGGCDHWGDGPKMRYISKYIGDGAHVQLTNYRPKDKGWHPYE